MKEAEENISELVTKNEALNDLVKNNGKSYIGWQEYSRSQDELTPQLVGEKIRLTAPEKVEEVKS